VYRFAGGHDPVNCLPVGLHGAKEELGTVGVGAGVGHGEDAGALVLELAAHANALCHALFIARGVTRIGPDWLGRDAHRNARKEGNIQVLVLELGAVDGLAAGAVVGGEVTTLAHEVRDDAVEARALETEALLASAERAEVLAGLGNAARGFRT